MDFSVDWPIFDGGEREALTRVLESRHWFNGDEGHAFEAEYAAFQGADHGIACTSGTTAIEVVLEALGIGPGDEVIVPPYTFIATATAVLRVGATPVFADVDETWCMNPAAAEAAITPKTKAIMPVHFGGSMANILELAAVASRHGVELIEDACHAWGSALDGRGAGTIGRCGVFSFQESKNLTAGEGGVIVTNDKALADRCHSIINCGREDGAPWYHHINLGTNARITEFQAALLRVQLQRYPEQLATREARARQLDAALASVPGLIPQPTPGDMTRRSYHLYCLRLDGDTFGLDRPGLLAAAEAAGLPLGAGYPLPLYQQPMFEKYLDRHDYRACACPQTEALCATEGLWLQQTVLLLSEAHLEHLASGLASLRP
jgi:dTDP-4-amino-4,6-dideoxygalactose transaminase